MGLVQAVYTIGAWSRRCTPSGPDPGGVHHEIYFRQLQVGLVQAVYTMRSILGNSKWAWSRRCTPSGPGPGGVHHWGLVQAVYTIGAWSRRCTPSGPGPGGVHHRGLIQAVYTMRSILGSSNWPWSRRCTP